VNGYDQWKTASPYDDEPDWVELAEKWLKRQREGQSEARDELIHIVRGLMDYINENV
jgi:hypothetical protein